MKQLYTVVVCKDGKVYNIHEVEGWDEDSAVDAVEAVEWYESMGAHLMAYPMQSAAKVELSGRRKTDVIKPKGKSHETDYRPRTRRA